MEPIFKRALGAKKSTVTDYRTVPLVSVQANSQFLNGVNSFQNDYSMIPVIDQGQEPECVACAMKVYIQKKIQKENLINPDRGLFWNRGHFNPSAVSTRAYVWR